MKENTTVITAETGRQELCITREFDAPRELVFRAHTEPELYEQWVGPDDLTMTVEKLEAGNDCSYRFVHEREGHKYTFHGVYHEVLTPERIIGTFEFDGLPET